MYLLQQTAATLRQRRSFFRAFKAMTAGYIKSSVGVNPGDLAALSEIPVTCQFVAAACGGKNKTFSPRLHRRCARMVFSGTYTESVHSHCSYFHRLTLPSVIQQHPVTNTKWNIF